MKLTLYFLIYRFSYLLLSMLLSTFLLPIRFAALKAQPSSYIIKRDKFRIPLSSVNISPDGSMLLAGFQDGSFSLLDPSSFEPQLEVKEAHLKAVNAMEISPKKEYILTAGHNSIFLWDLTGKN